VVGVDPSIAMLTRARGRCLVTVAGVLPGLPFPDASFDIALANLVLSHVSDYDAGLADVFRVLRRRGRFGGTAWGPDAPAEDQSDWAKADQIFDSLAVVHGIDVTPPTPPVPSEEPMRDERTLEAALRRAGLVDVDIQPHTYEWSSSIDEYFAGREWRPRTRYMRQQADNRVWQKIRDGAADELRSSFGETIRSTGHVWVVLGTKA
jgi:SAM-dependent methyltransferase